MTDMPNSVADLDAWVKRHKIAEPAKSSILPLLRSNLKNMGDSTAARNICIGQWNIVKGAATPRASAHDGSTGEK